MNQPFIEPIRAIYHRNIRPAVGRFLVKVGTALVTDRHVEKKIDVFIGRWCS